MAVNSPEELVTEWTIAGRTLASFIKLGRKENVRSCTRSMGARAPGASLAPCP